MWSQTLGHKKQIEQLQKEMRQEKVAHAYLFSGIEGIGKKRVAFGLAQALNCTSSNEIPCEKCSACQKIAKCIHPDVSLIEPDGKVIKVDVLRDLKQKAYLHPLEGKSKVFILEDAHKMTESSQNALLKILEEPPQQTYFILLTHQSNRLLPTIRSRSRLTEFNPLAEEIIEGKLVQDGISVDEAKARARLSQGSLLVATALDLELFQETRTKWETLRNDPKPTHILALSEAWSAQDEKILPILNTLSSLTHEKLMQSDDKTETDQWAKHWTAIETTKYRLETYANKRLLLESLLFTLTRS